MKIKIQYHCVGAGFLTEMENYVNLKQNREKFYERSEKNKNN